jgi:hypothetical protein
MAMAARRSRHRRAGRPRRASPHGDDEAGGDAADENGPDVHDDSFDAMTTAPSVEPPPGGAM